MIIFYTEKVSVFNRGERVRIIDPEKPHSHQGTAILNIHHGLQSPDDTEGTTIGYKRIARAEAMTTTRLRVTIEKARARPVISTVSVYLSPLS